MGHVLRDYIHVVDLVDAHLAALKHLSHGFIQIFNSGIGTGSTASS
jgi:UDP-glucose 4-epimerase